MSINLLLFCGINQVNLKGVKDMWDRVQFKERAKQDLGKDLFGKKWLMSALTSLLNMLVPFFSSGSAVLPTAIYSFSVIFSAFSVNALAFDDSAFFATSIMLTLFYGLFYFAMFALILLINVFVAAPLNIGFIRYFLALRDPNDNEAPSIALLFSCFKKGRYMQAVKGWGITLLYIQLWSFIPIVGTVISIIKYYEYFYVPYIMADNPDIDRKFATAVSTQMTNGEKGKIFVMQLSFLGWQIVGGLITIGNIQVISLWVTPYVQTSFANLYDFVKRRSIGTGLYRPEVFGIYPEGDPQDPYAQPFDVNAFYTRNRNYSRGCY